MSRALAEHNKAHPDALMREVLVHTGQHFDKSRSEVFFNELEMPEPAYILGIGELGHAAMTGRMTERIDEVIAHERPDPMLVYGDTNSTLAGRSGCHDEHPGTAPPAALGIEELAGEAGRPCVAPYG